MLLAIETTILADGLVRRWESCEMLLGRIKKREDKICLDRGNRILKAYAEQIGEETFQKWCADFSPYFDPSYGCVVAEAHQQTLAQHDCPIEPEQMFVAVASESGRVLITENSKLGKGRDGRTRNGQNVLDYLHAKFGVTVYGVTEAYYHFSYCETQGLVRGLQGRHFEIEVGEYLRGQDYSYVKTRQPFSLKKDNTTINTDIDVLAHKVEFHTLRVRVCECKLRTADDPEKKPVSDSDIEQLKKLVPAVRQSYVEEVVRTPSRPDLDFQAWLVTNVSTADDSVWESADACGFKLMTARLPAAWQCQDDWKVLEISSMTRTAPQDIPGPEES